MIKADRADHSRAKPDHDLIVSITTDSFQLEPQTSFYGRGGLGSWDGAG